MASPVVWDRRQIVPDSRSS